MRIFILLLATGGGSGYSPVAPGTAGSALAVGLYLLALLLLGAVEVGPDSPIGVALLVLATAAISMAGVWAAGRAERLLGKKDDGRITIDEVSGTWISLLTLPPRTEVLITGFLLFRIFDIWKPPPARHCEALGGGIGIMADDWVAAIYANLAGQLLWRILFPGGLW